MDLPLAVIIPLLLSLAAASFFFAAAESAFFSLGLWRAKRLVETRPARAAVVVRLLSGPDDLLATLVLGNSLANAFFVAFALLASIHGGWPLALSALGLFAALLLFCEVTPKALAVRRPDAWALLVAVPLEWLVRLSQPIRRLAQGLMDTVLRVLTPRSIKPQSAVSDEEYADLVELAHQQGALGRAEKELILQILSLDQRTARDIMRPRAQMVMLPDDLPPEQLIAAARKAGHHRIPLYDETPDTIVGVLDTKALLLNPNVDLADAIEFPSFVPESMNLLKLFLALQRQRRGLAVVMDEFGGTAGVVTMEDLLEEIVGEIRDEDEGRELILEKTGEHRWRVSGAVTVREFRRECPDLGDVPEVETMGGLITLLLDVVPNAGESTTYRGLKLTAARVDERVVREVTVERARGK